jgi:hypothetical protein
MLPSPIPVKEEQMSRSRTASAEVLLASFAGALAMQPMVAAELLTGSRLRRVKQASASFLRASMPRLCGVA